MTVLERELLPLHRCGMGKFLLLDGSVSRASHNWWSRSFQSLLYPSASRALLAAAYCHALIPYAQGPQLVCRLAGSRGTVCGIPLM